MQQHRNNLLDMKSIKAPWMYFMSRKAFWLGADILWFLNLEFDDQFMLILQRKEEGPKCT